MGLEKYRTGSEELPIRRLWLLPEAKVIKPKVMPGKRRGGERTTYERIALKFATKRNDGGVWVRPRILSMTFAKPDSEANRVLRALFGEVVGRQPDEACAEIVREIEHEILSKPKRYFDMHWIERGKYCLIDRMEPVSNFLKDDVYVLSEEVVAGWPPYLWPHYPELQDANREQLFKKDGKEPEKFKLSDDMNAGEYETLSGFVIDVGGESRDAIERRLTEQGLSTFGTFNRAYYAKEGRYPPMFNPEIVKELERKVERFGT